MRRLTVLSGLIVLLTLTHCSLILADQWYPGIVHAHSTFSDGLRNPEELVARAKQAGVKFLIVTDHYEQINSEYLPNRKKKWGAKIADDQGFDNYRVRFSQLESSNFVIITGGEITTFWGEGLQAASHILALGNLAFNDDTNEFDENGKPKYPRALVDLQCQSYTQQEVLDRLAKLGLLSVAAHPSFIIPHILPWEWPEIINYSFYPQQIENLKGIEIFNDHDYQQYAFTRNWYLGLLRQRKNIFLTSGCDSHSAAERSDGKRWQRKTWVYCQELSQKAILNAMSQGHTYAANLGAWFKSLNYLPGFKVQEVDKAEFRFEVGFEEKVESDKIIRIYRDGNLIPESLRRIPMETINSANLPSFFYVWEDKDVTGEHCYVIEVEGVLITSPIKIKIKKLQHQPKILFLKEGKLQNYEVLDLFAINPDGSGLIKVLPAIVSRNIGGYGRESRVSISSDGKKIAVLTARESSTNQVSPVGDAQLEIIDLEHPKERKIIPLKKYGIRHWALGHLCWSPDGKKLAFVSEENIYVINTDGTGLKCLFDNTENYPPFFTWLPNSNKIVFLKKTGKMAWDWGLFIAGPDGQIEPANFSSKVWAMPSWSLDGSKIAFTGEDCQLWVGDFLNNKVINTRRLTEEGIDGKCIWRKLWSRDGQQIAFTDFHQEMLAVINQDGTNMQIIQREIFGLVGWTEFPITEFPGIETPSELPEPAVDETPSITEIFGKYFCQERPDYFLELKRNRTAIWIVHDVCGMNPEDIYWRLNPNRKAIELYSLSKSKWKREFLIKGKGILVRSLDGTAWTKKGVSYSFLPKEVVGTYKFKIGKAVSDMIPYQREVIATFGSGIPPAYPQWLELRADKTCTLLAKWVINAIVHGTWEIKDNLIILKFPRRAWGREEHRIRVLDRNTLIWAYGLGYIDFVR